MINIIAAECLKAGTNDYTAYAGSESCRDCHHAEYNMWKQSHHALAERPLQPAVDQIAFKPSRTITNGTQTATAQIQNDIYQIVTLGPDSNRQPFRVKRVIGNYPLEQFLTPFPGGRYQAHEASCDVKSNQWFYVYGDDLRHPGEYGHWTGRGMNWNSQCAECHNTRLHKNYDPATDSYHTAMAEMSVGCEACHGPLKAHVEWRQKHPHANYPDPTIKRFSARQILDTCGSCHSRTTDLTENFQPGDSFFDHYALATLDNSQRWYPDGQVKDEDYEFVSFLSSKMHQAGVTCLDCHNPHSVKNTLSGNDLCMRCHNGALPNAPKINLAEHTHHAATSAGNLCVNCHMPVTVYMQRQPRRDHGFTIPDPLLTKEWNIPNACNRCHADKDADWALNHVNQWYGGKMNRPTRDRAEWIARAENGDTNVIPHLVGLLTETNIYWQVVAANFLGNWTDNATVKAALLPQLKSSDPLVRESVARALADADVSTVLAPMLNDSSRNVRVAAAWALRATVDLQSQAGKDLQRMLDLEADQPDGQFEAAMLSLARRQPAEALTHLKKATAWDKLSPPFLCTQAQVQDQLGQLAEALKTLDQAEAGVPDDPHIPYIRATILLRNGRVDEAKVAVKQALKLQSDFQPAMALQHRLLSGE